MTEDLGAGPALDENFDFSVGPTGDIAHNEGLAEVEKDLAANMAVELNSYVGSSLTPKVKGQILSDARITALLDERVTDVDKEASSVSLEDDGTIKLELAVTIATDEEYTLVFRV